MHVYIFMKSSRASATSSSVSCENLAISNTRSLLPSYLLLRLLLLYLYFSSPSFSSWREVAEGKGNLGKEKSSWRKEL